MSDGAISQEEIDALLAGVDMGGILKIIISNLYGEIGGNYPERFLNVCAANRIRLWGSE